MPANWPLIAASALCAAARSASIPRISAREASSRCSTEVPPAAISGFCASNASRFCSAVSRSFCREASCWFMNSSVSVISPRPPERFSSRKMSIIFWTISCASLALSASDSEPWLDVAVISNRLSCSLFTEIRLARPSTAPSISLGLVIVSPIRVARITFSMLTALVSVCRTRSMSRLRSPMPMPICSAKASSSCTKIRARDS